LDAGKSLGARPFSFSRAGKSFGAARKSKTGRRQ